jgi:hypothetical protein
MSRCVACHVSSSPLFDSVGKCLTLCDRSLLLSQDGTLTEEFAKGARERARSPHDGIRVGRVILRILGVV